MHTALSWMVYDLDCKAVENSVAQTNSNNKSVSYIKVEAHKTAYLYGSGDLVLRPTFMSFMKVYQKYFRTLYAKADNDKFFITKTGCSLSTSQVDASVKSAWKRCGLNTDKKITPNIARKSAATRVYENDSTQSADAAALMLHQLDTHSKHYDSSA
jgi:hypothetical protein